jgi:hypothetical protein
MYKKKKKMASVDQDFWSLVASAKEMFYGGLNQGRWSLLSSAEKEDVFDGHNQV